MRFIFTSFHQKCNVFNTSHCHLGFVGESDIQGRLNICLNVSSNKFSTLWNDGVFFLLKKGMAMKFVIFFPFFHLVIKCRVNNIEITHYHYMNVQRTLHENETWSSFSDDKTLISCYLAFEMRLKSLLPTDKNVKTEKREIER